MERTIHPIENDKRYVLFARRVICFMYKAQQIAMYCTFLFRYSHTHDQVKSKMLWSDTLEKFLISDSWPDSCMTDLPCLQLQQFVLDLHPTCPTICDRSTPRISDSMRDLGQHMKSLSN